jgi:hypothetical protein
MYLDDIWLCCIGTVGVELSGLLTETDFLETKIRFVIFAKRGVLQK